MRNSLKEGTWIRFPDGECYEITGQPIGEGGGGLLYPGIRRFLSPDGSRRPGNLEYVLKECFPVSSCRSFCRADSGEITADPATEENTEYLRAIQEMQLKEQTITGDIYKTGFRLTPILAGSDHVELSFDGGQSFHPVKNTVTIMESLSGKGKSLRTYLAEVRRIPLRQSFHIIRQVLFAVREIHEAGYLHLDIQDGNVFLRGSLSDDSDFISLIDFGSARRRLGDGKCAAIENQVIFSTEGFSAPEIIEKNDGTLRLGPEADLYSIGCLLLLLLTGRRYEFSELRFRTDGRYLTRARLRKIHCPSHLVPRLQQILAGALENDPEKRYHSCEEMLTEVSDFLTALEPARSSLSQVVYDAFICYKHGPIDSRAARLLQKNLEHFRPPRISGEKRSRLERIFVDEGELASCSDFGLEIREALKNAGWLIVICSPETKTSPWVELEIQTFLEFHPRSRILTVMTGGEPGGIFPDLLQNGEDADPLAADARGGSWKEIKRKLNGDALLKIAAPMLGLTYDSLKQRHRAYLFQRIAAVSLTFLLLLGSFTVYTLRQADRIREQYLQARKNLARYLSSISLDLYDSGDRDEALLTALAVEPEQTGDEAVVPEQMYALNRALNSYNNGSYADYAPACTAEHLSMEALSPDESFLCGIDKDGNVAVLSGETGELQWTLTPEDIKSAADTSLLYSSGETFDRIRLAQPASDGRLVLGLDACAAVFDPKTRTASAVFPTAIHFSESSWTYATGKDRLALAKNDQLYVYRLSSGQEEAHLDLSAHVGEHTTCQIESISFSEDGETAVIGVSCSYVDDSGFLPFLPTAEEAAAYQSASDAWFAKNPPPGLVLYDVKKQNMTVLSSTGAKKVLFADDRHVAALHFTAPVSGALSDDTWGNANYTYYPALYELASGTFSDSEAPSDSLNSGASEGSSGPGAVLVSGTPMTVRSTSSLGLTTEDLTLNGESVPVLLSWIRGSLTVIGISSGRILSELSYQSDIASVCAYDGRRLLAGLCSGAVQLIALDDQHISRYEVLSLDMNISRCTYNRTADRILLSDDDKIIFCSSQPDPDLIRCSAAKDDFEGMRIRSLQYRDTGRQIYRFLMMYQDSYMDTSGFLLYPVNSAESCFRYRCSEPDAYLGNFGFGCDKEEEYICFTEESSDGRIRFVKCSLTTGKTLIDEDMTKYETLSFYMDLVYSRDLNNMYAKCSSGGAARFDISGASAVPERETLLPDFRIDEMALTGDGRYLVLVIRDTSLSRRILYLYNTETKSVQPLECVVSFADGYGSDFIITGAESSLISLHDKESDIRIIDCETQKVVSTIEETRSSGCSRGFFSGDRALIVADENSLRIFDIENNHTAFQYAAPGPAFSRDIIADSGSPYFALKDSSISEDIQTDSGLNKQCLNIYYTDSDYQIYPFADVNYGCFSPSGGEISTCSGGEFAFSSFHDYSMLKARSQKLLNGRALTPEEKRSYFIDD